MKPEMKSVYQIPLTLAKDLANAKRTWLFWAHNGYNRDITDREYTPRKDFSSSFALYAPNSGAEWNRSNRGSNRTGSNMVQLTGREERKSLVVERTKGRGQLEAAASKHYSNLEGLFKSQEGKALSITYQNFSLILLEFLYMWPAFS